MTGVRESDDTICFKGEKAIFSNFNKKYPVTIEGEEFTCNEQYIVYCKAKIFNDTDTAEQVMALDDPRKIKQLGNNIRHYNHKIWKNKCKDIVAKCNRAKYTIHEDAMKQLLATKTR